MPALLLSINSNDPFIFNAEKDETPSKKYTAQEILQKYIGNKIPLEILNKDMLEALIRITNPDALNLIKRNGDYLHDTYDVETIYEFHKRYYGRLQVKEKKEEYNKLSLDLTCWEKANRYLSEILFGYRYYEKVVQHINGQNIVKSPYLNDFLDVIYSISEYPICFARIKHMEQNINKYFSPNPLRYLPKKMLEEIEDEIEADIEEKKIFNEARKILKKKIILQEEYTIKKFIPALFYCFLYYYETSQDLKKAFYSPTDLLKMIEEFVKTLEPAEINIHNFGLFGEKAFTAFAEDEAIKFLWNKRKKEYFHPLIYRPETALF